MTDFTKGLIAGGVSAMIGITIVRLLLAVGVSTWAIIVGCAIILTVLYGLLFVYKRMVKHD